MQPAMDPFHTLLRVIERYKHDVHELHPPPPAHVVESVAHQLGGSLPPSLAAFTRRWNGASLFRGVLRIRALADLSPALAEVPEVIVFADGPRPDERWAFAPDRRGGAIFGRWNGRSFEPLHTGFDRWLAATVRILDEDIRDPRARLEARLEADPDCPWLLVARAREALVKDPEAAARDLTRATALDPDLGGAWALLARALRQVDLAGARAAGLRALATVRLPRPWPGTLEVDAASITSLETLFGPGDETWTRALAGFVEDSVRDVVRFDELDLVEAVAAALARGRLARGARAAAHQGLVSFLDRVRDFQVKGPCVEAVLLLASVEVDLGHHDDAERRLRGLRLMPPPTPARAQLVLGRIAVMRQEPWAEEILGEALEGLGELPAAEARRVRCQVMLMLAERALLQQSWEAAGRAAAEALDLARQAEDSPLIAQSCIVTGDLNRDLGRMAEAEQWYARARVEAGRDEELLQRVLLRRGDLFRLGGDRERAAADYARAAAAFAALGLPLREAWARLRLAQLGLREAADQALHIFKAADMAAGVAAADAIAGDPARSLAWHLERTAEHARDRANAQRARPPLTRADAERPERRIGAHRHAIAACDVRVVHTLARNLQVSARSLDAATPRLTDPALARYVASADLIAAHRSFDASEVLIEQLIERRPGGLVGRGLVGAMARSPNAALVDSLLEVIEKSADPRGVAAAAEVLGWRRELVAVQPLLAVLRRLGHPAARKAAAVALGRIGDPAAADDLLDLLETPELADATSIALLLLGEWRGLDHQAQALASARPGLSRSAGEIVGRYGGPAYLLLLYRTAELDGAAGLGAVQGLGYMGDPRAVPRLMDVLGERDPNRRRVASGALELITGNLEDPEESLLRNRWVEWWEAHGADFRPGFRYRGGAAMDPGSLIQRLGHDNPGVRRSTYDELVISTGERLPFDGEGPYRVQLAHQAAWRRWWREHGTTYAPGRWTFHGEEIG